MVPQLMIIELLSGAFVCVDFGFKPKYSFVLYYLVLVPSGFIEFPDMIGV